MTVRCERVYLLPGNIRGRCVNRAQVRIMHISTGHELSICGTCRQNLLNEDECYDIHEGETYDRH